LKQNEKALRYPFELYPRNMKFGHAFIICVIAAAGFSCAPEMKLRDGRLAYERMQFSKAIPLLEKEFNQSKTRIEKGKLAFLIGNSLQRLNKNAQSIRWFRIAYDNQYGIDALRAYAFALKRDEQYNEAASAFKELGIEIGSPYEYRREINACSMAAAWKANAEPAEYLTELLDFNSKFSDFAPVPYRGDSILFTSDRSKSANDKIYSWTGQPFSDLYISDGLSSAAHPFAATINSPDNEGTATFNADFSEMVFVRCFGGKKEDAFCKLMTSKLESGTWSNPQVLDFVQDKINYVQPCLSPDGQTLYFASDRSDGWGGFDLFVSTKINGSWSEPIGLSRTINTVGDEKFPFIDRDTLYFSSNHHPGMGGLDIFKTYKMANGGWSPPYNLKPPVNSGSDDFALVVANNFPEGSDTLQIGYFSTSREDGFGQDDIYRFIKRIPPLLPTQETAEDSIRRDSIAIARLILDVYVLEKIFETPTDPNSKVLGRKPLADASVELRFGNESLRRNTDAEGLFSLFIEPDAEYAFLASSPGYLNNAATFSARGLRTEGANADQRFEMEVVLERIFTEKEIRLEDIYYDFDRWEIRADARPSLDKLARILLINPGIRIQLGSHTDCRGNDRYNQDLSQKRAQAAVDYLIEKGVAFDRLIAQGFGELVPETNCICSRCSEEEHQRNRRTTFKILE
jgi:peptidoglycan-associated lipoprotein